MPRSLLTFVGLVLFTVALVGCRPSEAADVPPASGTPEAERGAALYLANCQSCHGGASEGSMMDLPPRHNANGHTWHHPDCQLVEFVLDRRGSLEPMSQMMRQMMGAPQNTPVMPAWRDILTEEQVHAILGYIKTLWTAEQRGWQAEATRRACPSSS